MPIISKLPDAIVVDDSYIPRTSLFIRTIGDKLSIHVDNRPILAEIHFSKIIYNDVPLTSIDELKSMANDLISA